MHARISRIRKGPRAGTRTRDVRSTMALYDSTLTTMAPATQTLKNWFQSASFWNYNIIVCKLWKYEFVKMVTLCVCILCVQSIWMHRCTHSSWYCQLLAWHAYCSIFSSFCGSLWMRSVLTTLSFICKTFQKCNGKSFVGQSWKHTLKSLLD